MTQYHVKIWETVEFDIAKLGFPRNIPSVESDIEAHTIETAMKLALLATSFKSVALITVVATSGQESAAYVGVRRDNEGRVTHSQTKETTPEYRVPGIFMKSDLN